MKYKVGDKVRTKSLDWYNENKDEFGQIPCKGFSFVISMTLYCDSILTIEEKTEDCYCVKENVFCWTDEMIEGLVEEEMPLDKAGQITDFEYEGLAYSLPNGYQFVDENGNVINATKIVLEKKKKEYPKTFEECCGIVGEALKWDNPFRINIDTHPYIKHLDILIESFCKLLICRDAYWKIAGEEMGLGKSWKPSWDKCTGDKYCISSVLNTIRHDAVSNTEYHNRILAFPTEEMRDAFYENFKEFINECKELL